MAKKALLLFLCLAMMFCMVACGGRRKGSEADLSEEESLEQGDEACNHLFSPWQVERNRTCETDGLKMRECTFCGREESAAWPATGHDFDGKSCKTCGAKAPSCKHIKCETVVVDAATCTAEGVQHSVCKSCKGIVNTRQIPALEHQWTDHEGKAPTCTEHGWNAFRACLNCGESDYRELEAVGHDYFAGVCRICGDSDSDIAFLKIDPIKKNIYVAPPAAENPVKSPATGVDMLKASLSADGETDLYALTADYAGVYRVWITGLDSGSSVRVYVKDYMGKVLAQNTNCKHNEGLSVFFDTPGTYNIEICQYKGKGDYYLNVGHQAPSMDLSAYTSWMGSFDYEDQEYYFAYAPVATGTYSFSLENMTSGTYAALQIFTQAGELVVGNNTLYSGDSISTVLSAGEVYFIGLFQKNQLSPVDINILKPKSAVDISGHNVIKDSIDYRYQDAYYTFTAEHDRYTLSCGGLSDSKSRLSVELYDPEGERVAYSASWGNGQPLTVEGLAVGETYILRVGYGNAITPFEVCLYAEKPASEVSGKVIIEDSIEFSGQINVYRWTAVYDGDVSVLSLGEEGTISIHVYDEQGNLLTSQTSCHEGEGPVLHGAHAGETYRICVEWSGVTTPYVIAIQ